jgi:hypothetical protein
MNDIVDPTRQGINPTIDPPKSRKRAYNPNWEGLYMLLKARSNASKLYGTPMNEQDAFGGSALTQPYQSPDEDKMDGLSGLLRDIGNRYILKKGRR